MLQNYFKIAIRTMLRNKSYSLINIFGLSIGVACCLLLCLYVYDEMSYDQHHADLENIYRINSHIRSENGSHDLGTTSPPVGVVMKEEIIGIESAARMVNPPGVAQNLIRYEDKLFYESDGFIADSTVFDVLTYEFLEGNPKKALTEANAVVINDLMAQKLFGREPALNKVISISQGGEPIDYKITGVVKSGTKSIIRSNFFVSMTSSSGMANYLRSDAAMNEWAGQNFIPAFVKLKAGQSKEDIENQMNQVLVKFGAEDMKAIGFSKTLSLEPLQDIYLKSTIGRSARINYLFVIGSIGIFILLIACINFMNLATAKATKRAGEVGVRKVMGAFRSSLIQQFMGEALAIVVIALLLSMVFVQLSLPLFNELTGKNIELNKTTITLVVVALSFIGLITGIVAGSYPALYLSSFQPAQVLKGKLALNHGSGWLRRSLVVFQFVIAIALVCGMIVISQQLNFMQSKALGFDTSAKVALPLRTESARKNYEVLSKNLKGLSAIQAVSGTEYIPGAMIWSDAAFYTAGSSMNKAHLNRRNAVDFGYLEMMDIKIIAGRSFHDNRQSESDRKVVINRTSANRFGISPEEIIGQSIFTEWQGTRYEFQVIGVMEDFHQTSLKEQIFPILFELVPQPDQLSFAVVNLKTENFSDAILQIEQLWKQLISDTPFEYSFLDENIQNQYAEDKKVAGIITSFTVIAMFISCLGLYGLSSFMAERRIKEIGIRKVLGANINQIVGLMTKEFVKLVMVAFFIAVPLSWYLMNEWLQTFAYKISIDLQIFAWAGLAALLIALLTVSFESIRAALGNPVDSLRNE